jgi:hypothetical protein
MGRASSIDWRLLVPIAFFIVGSIKFNPRPIVTQLLFLLIVLNVATVYSKWKSYQPEYGNIIAAVDKIKPGSKLFTSRAYDSYRNEVYPFAEAPLYAVINRQAFVPALLAFPSQQPVQFAEPYVALARATDRNFWSPVDWDLVLKNYDYVLLAREDKMEDLPRSGLRAVWRHGDLMLYVTQQ